MSGAYLAEPYDQSDPVVRESAMQAAATKATPIDADSVILIDSAASNAIKRTLWSDLKTTLSNLFHIKLLTGYVSGAGTVSATDTILQAIQKLNGNDATNANLTGPITSVGNATSVASQTGTGSTFAMSAGPTFTGLVSATNAFVSGYVQTFRVLLTTGGYFGLPAGSNFFELSNGVVQVRNSSNALCQMQAANILLSAYTVATLPSAAANTRARTFVSDSNLAFSSANLGSTVTAGGSTLVPVFSNGTNWVIG